MSRFEINVQKNGYVVYDEYWDNSTFEHVTDAKTPKAVAVKLVDELVKSGDTHKWFAVGTSGHKHIFDIPTTATPIPGRHRRYTK